MTFEYSSAARWGEVLAVGGVGEAAGPHAGSASMCWRILSESRPAASAIVIPVRVRKVNAIHSRRDSRRPSAIRPPEVMSLSKRAQLPQR